MGKRAWLLLFDFVYSSSTDAYSMLKVYVRTHGTKAEVLLAHRRHCTDQTGFWSRFKLSDRTINSAKCRGDATTLTVHCRQQSVLECFHDERPTTFLYLDRNLPTKISLPYDSAV